MRRPTSRCKTNSFAKTFRFWQKSWGNAVDAVVVKGRSNYVCNLKWEKESVERKRLALYDSEDEQVTFLRRWLGETGTGDIDDLPFVPSNDLRTRVVSYPDDCIGRSCGHFEDNCFVNQMRDRARQAQVIITNHHLLLNALELGEIGFSILPEASIYVIDEAHQLESTATSVFEVETSDYALEQLLARAAFKAHLEQEQLESLLWQNRLAFAEAEGLSEGKVFRLDCELEELQKLAGGLKQVQDELRQANPYELPEEEGRPQLTPDEAEDAANYDLAVKGLGSLAAKFQAVASGSLDDRIVRYGEKVSGSRHLRLRLHAAPIDPANQLAKHLFAEDGRTVICTSATLATDGNFDHFKSRCGVQRQPHEFVAGPVFDYTRQAVLYQPQLPAFDWRERERFYDGVAAEIERLLNVSRGRALCLFTSWTGLRQVHERLVDVVWPVQAQGQLPRNSLLDWFRETQHSVLLATKSFWEGVDLPGRRPEPGRPRQAAVSVSERPTARGSHECVGRSRGREQLQQIHGPADDAGAQAGIRPAHPAHDRPGRGGDSGRKVVQQKVRQPARAAICRRPVSADRSVTCTSSTAPRWAARRTLH